MLYEKYKNAMQKIASVVKFIKRHRVLFIALICSLITCISACVAVTGVIYDVVDCPTEVVYGGKFEYKASALFKDVYYEFAPQGTNAWTQEVPREAGNYQVRAVSKRAFGSISYGDVHSFTIQPKEVEVYVSESKIEYGTTPKVAADLVEGDEISCQLMSYKDLDSKEKSRVTPVKEAIKVVDDEGKDVTSSYAFVPVEKEIEFTQRKIEISIDGLEEIYDGKTYESHEYEIVQGELAFDDSLSFTFTQKITNVGSVQNTADIQVINGDGLNVYHQYYVLIKCGDLVINKRNITLETGSNSFLYDGDTHTEYTCEELSSEEEDYGLLKGHKLVRNENVSSSIVNVGEMDNVLEYFIRTSDGEDVTSNYNIEYIYGKLTVTPRPIHIVTNTSAHVYDGRLYSDGGFDYATDTEYKAVTGHEIKVATDLPGVKYVESASTVNEFEVKIWDEETDVSDNYTISYTYGTISITSLAITFTVTDDDKVYDGGALLGSKYTTSINLAQNDQATVRFVGDITDVGTADCEIIVDRIYNDERDVTNCYAITCEKGTLEITPRPIMVTTGSETWTYDGVPHSNTAGATADDLVLDHKVVYDGNGAKEVSEVLRDETDNTLILTYENKHGVIVVNGEGKDLTNNYIIDYTYGQLTITPRVITVTTGSETWTYDGKEHSNTTGATADDLVLDHKVVYDGKGATEESEVLRDETEYSVILAYENVHGVIVVNANGKDITYNYNITDYYYGKLTIQPRSITATTGSEAWIYDGDKHSKTDGATADDLVLDHKVVYDGKKPTEESEVLRSETDYSVISSYENIHGVIVVDGKDNDVTYNYDIRYEYGKLTINPRPIHIQTNTSTHVYDGEAYSDNGFDYAADTAYKAVDGHEIKVATEAPSVKYVEAAPTKNEFTVKVWNGETDVSSNYTIRYTYGTIAITPFAITFTATDDSKVYDGTTLYGEEYTVSPDLVKEDKAEVRFVGEITDVGEEDCQVIIDRIYNDEREDITNCYAITCVAGKLTITPRPITVTTGSETWTYDGATHSKTDGATADDLVLDHKVVYDGNGTTKESEVLRSETDYSVILSYDNEHGVVVVTEAGEDVTRNYSISYEYGQLTINPRPITATTGSETWTYDGNLHSKTDGATADDLVLDHKVVYDGKKPTEESEVLRSETDYSVISSYENIHGVIVVNGAGKDISYNYEIDYVYGDLTINPRPIHIQTNTSTHVYDGNVYTDGGFDYAADTEYKAVEGHEIKVATTLPGVKYVEAETTLNEFGVKVWAGETDVSYNYDISYTYGTIAITPLAITFTVTDNDKVYDGTPLYGEEYTTTPDLVKEDQAEVRFVGEITNVGTEDCEIIVDRIYNDERDVTNCYVITCEKGTLEITPRPIVVTTGSETWTYDGNLHSKTDGATADDLVLDHKVVYDSKGATEESEVRRSKTDYSVILSYDNEHGVIVLNGNGDDVTGNYDIIYDYGKLTINPRPITATTGSETWTYDGNLHSKTDGATADDLVLDHKVVYDGKKPTEESEVLRSETDYSVISSYENIHGVIVVDGKDNDVTYNYDISYEYGKLTINPRPIHIQTNTSTHVYDGNVYTDGGFDYAADTEYKAVEGHEIKVATTLPGVKYVEAAPTANEFGVKVWNGKTDVSGNYTISYTYGTIAITPLAITFTVTDNDKVYDGTPLYGVGYTTTPDLVKEDQADVRFIGEITNVGTEDCEIIVDRIYNDERDVTNCYVITCEKGTLEITPRPIVVTTGSETWTYDGNLHSKTDGATADDLVLDHKVVYDGNGTTKESEVLRDETDYSVILSYDNEHGVVVVTEAGEDVTRNYSITYKYGQLTINPRPITVVTGGGTWTYDGQVHCNDTVIYVKDATKPDEGLLTEKQHTWTPNNDWTEVINVGTYENGRTINIYDGNNDDVTYNYDITYDRGELIILPREIWIHTGSGEWYYDTGEHSNNSETYVMAPTNENNGLVQGQTYMFSDTDYTKVIDAGKYTNMHQITIWDAEGNVATGNYTVFYTGELTIKQRKLEFTTGDGEWLYDGEPHSNDKDTKFVEKLNEEGYGFVGDHTYNIVDYAQITDIGEMANWHIFEIIAPDGTVVTGNYDITVHAGTLKVTAIRLIIETGSDKKVYDGTALTNNEITIAGDGLLPGHKFTAELMTTGEQIDAGSSYNTLNIELENLCIVNENNEDVTRYYKIELECGLLTVTKRQVKIVTATDTKAYDGTALTNEKVTIEGDGLLAGHSFSETLKAIGSQTLVGESLNGLNVALEDLYIVNEEVTKNYAISIECGLLTVTKRQIKIVTATDTKAYDGTALTNEKVTITGDGLLTGHSFSEILKATGSQTEVGSSDNTLNVALENLCIVNGNEDVSGFYEISLVVGQLTVAKRTITITTASDKKVYDGEPLTNEKVTITGDGLLLGHDFDEELIAIGEQTEIGESFNELNVEQIIILDKNGNNVTESLYEVKIVIGKLVVVEDDGGGGGGDSGGLLDLSGKLDGGDNDPEGEPEVIFSFTSDQSGSVYFRIMSYGNYTYNGWGVAKTYTASDLTVNPLYFTALALAAQGYPTSQIKIKDIIGNMYWMSTYYTAPDGSGILNDSYIEQSDWDEYTLDLYAFNYLKDQGFNLSLQGTEYEEMESKYWTFVSEYYTKLPNTTKARMLEIIAEKGLDKDSPTIIEDVANFVRGYRPYDAKTPNYEGDYAIYFFDKAETAVCRHYATAATAIYRALGIPARYTVGYLGTSDAGQESYVTEDRAHAWVEVYIQGLGWIPVEVTGSGGGGGGNNDELKTELRIKPLDVQVPYDEENPIVYAQNRLDEFYLQEYLKQGYYYEVQVAGQQEGIGVSESWIVDGSFRLYDRYGNDVTDQFKLKIEKGSIVVYGEVYAEIYYFEIKYDGKEHSYADYNKWYYMPQGYELVVDREELAKISIKDVGTLNMSVFADLSVTVKYNGQVLEGTKVTFIGEPMRITPRSVVFIAGSSIGEYEEGVEFTNSEIELTVGSLLENHAFKGETSGMLDAPGKTENKIVSIEIYDKETGEDVTSNYSIEVVSGQLVLK